MARRLDLATPLPTFSAIFDDVPECDERSYIDAVLTGGGFEPHRLHADQISPLVDVDRILDHEDEPFYAPNLFMHWGLYGLARDHDVSVLLDGVDGDTTVSHGLLRLAELLRGYRWGTLATEALALSRRLERPLSQVVYRYALRPAFPARRPPVPQPSPLIDRRFAERIGFADRLRNLAGGAPPRTQREDHTRRLASGVVPFALEVADKAAAAFGIEPRYPYFDRRLVELCLALRPRFLRRTEGYTALSRLHTFCLYLPG